MQISYWSSDKLTCEDNVNADVGNNHLQVTAQYREDALKWNSYICWLVAVKNNTV